MTSFKELLKATARQIKRANETSAELQMKEIEELKFQEPHKFKSKANEDQYQFNLKLAETFDSAKSIAERTNLENVKSDLIECEKFLVERQKTDSSCWQVWIRLEYGQRLQRTWSCRWFGRRKRHPQCWETCPCSYVFSKKEVEVFSSGCDQKIFSAPRVGFVFKFLALPARHC